MVVGRVLTPDVVVVVGSAGMVGMVGMVVHLIWVVVVVGFSMQEGRAGLHQEMVAAEAVVALGQVEPEVLQLLVWVALILMAYSNLHLVRAQLQERVVVALEALAA